MLNGLGNALFIFLNHWNECDHFYYAWIFAAEENYAHYYLCPNQGSLTTSSLHFCVFLLHYCRWFSVTFLSSWLLKWDLAFRAPSRVPTMTGWKMYPRAAGVYKMLLWLGGTSPAFLISVRNLFFQPAVILTIATARLWDLGIFFCFFFPVNPL